MSNRCKGATIASSAGLGAAFALALGRGTEGVEPFLRRVLEPPSYGFLREGRLQVPTRTELWREFFGRLNVVRSKKQWLPLWSWISSLALLPFVFVFVLRYFNIGLLAVGFFYSMVVLGTHGTMYLHRYCTHRSFAFTSPAWRFVCRNLVIKIVSEELYVVSHHVHHRFADTAGDPYNANGGWLYCFLADVNHQPIAKNLTEGEYRRAGRLLGPAGLRLNSYQKYQTWGSLSDPARTLGHYVLNWTFWYAVYFAVGGHALATAIFGASFFWAFGIRTFNFDGHGRGRDARRAGHDFHRSDRSINQWWPGYVAGEWHNNHHLYPTSARSGFLPHQLDLAWSAIRACALLGGVEYARCDRRRILRSGASVAIKDNGRRRDSVVCKMRETFRILPAGARTPPQATRDARAPRPKRLTRANTLACATQKGSHCPRF